MGRKKLLFLADDMIVYVENPKETAITKKSPGIRDCSKVVQNKVNIVKSITFLFTSNKQVEFETKNTVSFTLVPPQKNSGININITKYVQVIYEENLKSLMKEIRTK